MNRRRLTLKRIDPWSVLKFGTVANLALLVIGLIGFGILWLVITQLDLIDKVCSSVGDLVLGLEDCGINGGALFGRLLLLGLLGVVVQTGVLVFLAFLYNLIADLTGGLTFGFLDESGEGTSGAKSVRLSDTSGSMTAATGASTTATRRVGGESGARPAERPDSGTSVAPGAPSTPTVAAGWSSRPEGPSERPASPERTTPSSSEGGPPRPSSPTPGPASTGAGSWRPSDRPRGGEDDLFGSRRSEDDQDRDR